MTQRSITGIVAALALIVGIVGAVYIAPPDSSSSKFAYLQSYPEPRSLPDFELQDHNGLAFTREDLTGHWTLVFLGYTYCPDICPTTLAALNAVYPQIEAIDSDNPVKVLFISVDPNRDTTERLAEYIGFFNSAFTAVTGEHTQLFALVRSMGMMYAIAGSTQDPDYLVDHSASVALINPNAQVIGRFKPTLEPGKLAVADTQHILHDIPLVLAE
ncbi:SCO family protein [Alteromonas aestuariivivens]|uniref:SCO family protein n=1 Tax=Alteromonas aestuariivivens TaxID=1938339 RepID=A0A3D8M5N6_9ALTE|nr:SCO family protein [Alteromonas aestuariivivens]RDV24845.1 SCO family protein [Alteromonas aestuariivivens]